MKHKLPAIALFLVIVVGVLVFSPVGRGSSVADLGTVVQSGPNIYAAEMDSYVCLSESEVHTTASLTTASADSEDRDFMPTVFLMMLDVGVCASLSPSPSTTRILAQPGAEKKQRPWTRKRQLSEQNQASGTFRTSFDHGTIQRNRANYRHKRRQNVLRPFARRRLPS